LLEVLSYETQSYYNSALCKQKPLAYWVTEIGVKAHMDPCFTLVSGCAIELILGKPRFAVTAIGKDNKKLH
jgi:hypothetical protein